MDTLLAIVAIIILSLLLLCILIFFIVKIYRSRRKRAQPVGQNDQTSMGSLRPKEMAVAELKSEALPPKTDDLEHPSKQSILDPIISSAAIMNLVMKGKSYNRNSSRHSSSKYEFESGDFNTSSTSDSNKQNAGDSTTVTMGSNRILAIPGYAKRNIEKEFQIHRMIGKGASADVYEATIISSEVAQITRGAFDKVAIKRFKRSGNEETADGGTTNQLFEIAIMGTIPPHPNVVNFLGYCETPCCIVLKWYPTNLKTFILDDNSPFTLDLFEKFSYEIARGMEHIHVNGVVHFDLKPLNIFLEEEADANLSLNGGWRCVIGDFGIAKLVDSGAPIPKLQVVQGVSIPKSVGMTLMYASPELITFKRVEFVKEIHKKIDVFAYSIIMVQMMKRDRPWGKIGNVEISKLILQGERPSLPEKFLHIVKMNHSFLIDIIKKAWAQDPQDRPEFSEIVAWFERERSKPLVS